MTRSYILECHLFNVTLSRHLVSFTVPNGKVYCVSPKWWSLNIYYSEKKVL